MTVLMTDVDFPSNALPSEREFLLWAVSNVRAGDLASADTLAKYVGPCPAAHDTALRVCRGAVL